MALMPELALVSRENELGFLSLDPDGLIHARAEAITGALWPSPRPGRREWAFSVVREGRAALQYLNPSGTTEVAASASTPPRMIGARLAHYAAWSPAGDQLCYVLPGERALELRVWTPGGQSSRALLSGAPLFPAWMPGREWLVCHHGSSLSALHVSTGEQRVLSASAAGFRTPAVREDGLVAWAEVSDGGVFVTAGSLEREPRRLAKFSAGVALAFSANSDTLLASVAASPEAGVFGELVVIGIQSASIERRVVKGPFVAAWFSPDTRRVATLHPTYSGDGRFQVRVHSIEGRYLGATEGFIPSSDMATVVGFFDQYGLSHPLWSPDGRWFTFSGRFVVEGPHPSFSGSGGDDAWLWDTTVPATAPTSLGPAQLAVFGAGEVNGG